MESLLERTPFRNPEIAELVRERYSLMELDRLVEALRRRGTLDLVPLSTGLFSASSAGAAISDTGYGNVWVRDCVQVAHALRVDGEVPVAAGAARGLLRFYSRHRHRFERIVAGTADPENVMLRPHVRFDGATLAELPEPWPHAQNDALGYFLWLYSGLAREGAVEVGVEEASLLALFPPYFAAIRFWQDEDSGHWEEVRKVSASSLGTVVAGLEALARLVETAPASFAAPADLRATIRILAARGREALAAILPAECSQGAPEKNRRYDAALAFLLYPLGVVEGAMADLILHDVKHYLGGRHGIRRYLRDSYYAPDFDRDYPAERRTTDHSAGTEERDLLLLEVGLEAQWCVFDPILSACHGERYLRSGAERELAQQVRHLNRSLAQVTEDWRCPELRYLQTVDGETGRREYRPNRHTPLQWTQANLRIALGAMRRSLAAGG